MITLESVFILIVVNFILNILIILLLFKNFFKNRIEFRWNTTCWMKKKIGIEMWWWDEGHFTGTRIFHFNWRDEEKLEEIDYYEFQQIRKKETKNNG